MARIKNRLKVYEQIEAPSPVAQDLATALGLAAGSNERRAQNVILRAHPDNSDPIYIGESDVTGTKCYPLNPGDPLEINAEDSGADEDVVFVELADIFILGNGVAGQKLIVASLVEEACEY